MQGYILSVCCFPPCLIAYQLSYYHHHTESSHSHIEEEEEELQSIILVLGGPSRSSRTPLPLSPICAGAVTTGATGATGAGARACAIMPRPSSSHPLMHPGGCKKFSFRLLSTKHKTNTRASAPIQSCITPLNLRFHIPLSP